MAISKRKAAGEKKERDIEKLEKMIDKGGSSIQKNRENDDDELKVVNVRMWQSVIREIDELLPKIPKKERPKRHGWIIEAVMEKLERDKKLYK
ncbi:hypothetical protein [Flexithrix dorotheae]|uniref:hypothetical protein n=1 Tax=Flexithrix dorotheae TaxID=70993 RepID=UPI00035C64A5|nr:hypothetical protein [Flexithrix dorotheae]